MPLSTIMPNETPFRPQIKVKKVEAITVGDFFRRHKTALKLRRLGSSRGFDHRISEPTVNRPGLALAGFYSYFAKKRIQVIGNQEFAYLESLGADEAKRRFAEFCNHEMPCIIVCRNLDLAPELLQAAEEAGVAVFQTTMVTMAFINTVTIALEMEFAPGVQEHGCMVDVRGIGVLIKGDAGTGKSETALGLVERGHSLVADDVVDLRLIEGREIVGQPLEQGRFYMEVRGLGIINIPSLYGIASIRLEKRLDMVIWLRTGKNAADFERLGMEQGTYEVLGLKVPYIELPVMAGRNMAQLVEVAALDQKLRSHGHNSALNFSKNLVKIMRRKRIT